MLKYNPKCPLICLAIKRKSILVTFTDGLDSWFSNVTLSHLKLLE